MVRIICAVLVCLFISACDQSPQAIEARKIEEIRKEQQRESAEYDRMVTKQNRDAVVQRNNNVNSNAPNEIKPTENVTNNPDAYNDNDAGYSIVFPKGWKVERINVNGNYGMQATSENGTQITTSGTRQAMPNMEFTNEFAKYFAASVTVPLARQFCSEPRITEAYAATFSGNDAIVNTFKCDDQFVSMMYAVHGGITYSLTTVYNKVDKVGYRMMSDSVKTFIITH